VRPHHTICRARVLYRARARVGGSRKSGSRARARVGGSRKSGNSQRTQAPGFVAGYWTRREDSDKGLSMIVFESEDAANETAARIGSMAPEDVTVEDVEVREVVASA
jgi:hypothetical protein